MRLDLLTQRDEHRAIRLDSRITRINYVLERDKKDEPRCKILAKEKHRRELELEILDLRSEELAEAGALPTPRVKGGGAALSDAAAAEA